MKTFLGKFLKWVFGGVAENMYKHFGEMLKIHSKSIWGHGQKIGKILFGKFRNSVQTILRAWPKKVLKNVYKHFGANFENLVQIDGRPTGRDLAGFLRVSILIFSDLKG